MKNKYKLELKKIEHSPKLSEETHAFHAELWANGELIAYCKNEGHGGTTEIDAVKGKEKSLNEIIQWAKTLPPVQCHNFTLDYKLEFAINDLLNEYLFQKKIKNLIKKNIVFTINNDRKNTLYCPVKLGRKSFPIEELMQSEDGKNFIKELCDEVKKENGTIHNTNIPDEWK